MCCWETPSSGVCHCIQLSLLSSSILMGRLTDWWVYMCTCFRTRMPMGHRMHIEFKGQPQVLALHAHLVWGKGFLIVSICASYSRILAGALLGDSPATTSHTATGILHTPHWTQLYRFWGFELRTSSFPNKHFYPLRYHPGPTSIILTNLFLFYNAGDRTWSLTKMVGQHFITKLCVLWLSIIIFKHYIVIFYMLNVSQVLMC